jgi:hypothetical protein
MVPSPRVPPPGTWYGAALNTNTFWAETNGAGLSVSSTARKSLPSPIMKLTTSTVDSVLSVPKPVEPKLTFP